MVVVLSIGLLVATAFVPAESFAGSAAAKDTAKNQSVAKTAKTPDRPQAAPKAEAVNPIFEFEPVLDGETVTHTFTIKNTGNAELRVLKVRTG